MKIIGMQECLDKIDLLKNIANIMDVRDTADNMVNAAKSYAPVDTGNLMNSIDAEVTADTDSIQVKLKADADYAQYVECGTSKMPAQPFLTPAFYEYKDEITEKIDNNIKEVCK